MCIRYYCNYFDYIINMLYKYKNNHCIYYVCEDYIANIIFNSVKFYM